jgi:multidrug transporter EmrE-like cation transporter
MHLSFCFFVCSCNPWPFIRWQTLSRRSSRSHRPNCSTSLALINHWPCFSLAPSLMAFWLTKTSLLLIIHHKLWWVAKHLWCTYPYSFHHTLSFLLFCVQFFIVLSCLISVSVNFSTFLVIGKTSPVTYQVLGHLKTCLVLTFGYVLLHDPFSWRNILGILIAVVGMVLYSYFCTVETQHKNTEVSPQQVPFSCTGEISVWTIKFFCPFIGSDPVCKYVIRVRSTQYWKCAIVVVNIEFF